jgi:hypothetical protein
VQDPGGIPIDVDGYVGSTDVAYASPNFVLVEVAGSGGLRRVTVDPVTGHIVDRTPPVTCCPFSFSPVLTYDGATFILLYEDSATRRIHGTRITSSGVDLDPTDWDLPTGLLAGTSRIGVASLRGAPGKSPRDVRALRRDAERHVGLRRDALADLRGGRRIRDPETDGQTTAVPGQMVTYTMTVANAGPGAALRRPCQTPSRPRSGVTWTCAGSGGAVCPSSGTGSIAHTVNLPAGGSVHLAA